MYLSSVNQAMFESASSQHDKAAVRLKSAWGAYPPEPDMAGILRDIADDDAKQLEHLLSVDMEAGGKRGLPATLAHYQQVLTDQVRPGGNLTRAILERELRNREMSFGPNVDVQHRKEYDSAYWTDLEAVTKRCWRRLKSAVTGEGSSVSKLLQTPSTDPTDA